MEDLSMLMSQARSTSLFHRSKANTQARVLGPGDYSASFFGKPTNGKQATKGKRPLTALTISRPSLLRGICFLGEVFKGVGIFKPLNLQNYFMGS
jgi:hypothetical protein